MNFCHKCGMVIPDGSLMCDQHLTWWSRQGKWTKAILVILGIGILGNIITTIGNGGDKYSTSVSSAAAVQPAPPPAPVINLRDGGLTARAAIRYQAKNPDGVEFAEKTYERISEENMTYECKWRIAGTNSYGAKVTAYGYAKVKYKGKGETLNTDNWDVVKAYIDDGQ